MKRPNSSARSKIAGKIRWRVIGAGLTCSLLATLVAAAAAAPSESPPSTLSDLHLLRPLWLLALIPSIALIAALWRGHLRKNDCALLREGGSHSWWGNPHQHLRSSVPRHSEIKDNLACKICKDLGVPFVR